MSSQASGFLPRLRRYAIAFIGPASTAGTHFLLSLVALRLLPAGPFGHFSFLMVVSQFAIGIWSALFCAPLPVIMADGDARRRERLLEAALIANLVALIPFTLVFFLVGATTSLPKLAALFFAAFAAMSLLRWFARANSYAKGALLPVLISDLTYTLVLLFGLAMVFLFRLSAAEWLTGFMLLAAGVATATFGGRGFHWHLPGHWLERLRAYPMIWRSHSGWSLLGVLTTEATINAQAYIVTLLSGPGAFALLVASALLTRPVTVMLGALGEYERAQMAREIAARDVRGLRRSLQFFRLVMIGVWLATALAITAVFLFVPRLVFPAQYRLSDLVAGSVMWMAVMLVRALRQPDSAMMQGAGQFKVLARASCWSALCSVVGVLAITLSFGPLWSILGILAGELVFGAHLWPAARAWQRAHMGEPPASAGDMRTRRKEPA